MPLQPLYAFATLSVCRWRSSAVERLICNQRVGGSIPSASLKAATGPCDRGIGRFACLRASADGEVAKRSNASDCKSDGPRPSKVRILPSPPCWERPGAGERRDRERGGRSAAG